MSTTTCYSSPAAVPGAGGAAVASEAAATAAADHQSRKNNLSLYANLPAAEIIDSLPLETRFPAPNRLYGGFWKAEFLLKGLAAGRTRTGTGGFEPKPADIVLASLPKSGTTWLKALAFATLNRGTHPPSNAVDGQHPLSHRNPHDCVSFLELMMIQGVDATAAAAADAAGAASGDDRGSALPRLVATHLPCSWLPPTITGEGGSQGCRIVYVCREPKDVLISYWTFSVKAAAKFAAAAAGGKGDGGESAAAAAAAAGTSSFEEAFELYCEGRFPGGPHWLHALEFWRESQRRPDEVLFLRYEDMLRDPVGNVKKLAAFMGCPFSEEEETEGGVVDQIVALCSLENLKSMEVNKNGSTTVLGVTNDAFFRKGQVGDWKNYMSPDMAARLDKVVEEATRGSGLSFADSVEGVVNN